MSDILCKLMGGADIIAGGLIMYLLNLNAFGVIFGVAMIIKGIMSFAG